MAQENLRIKMTAEHLRRLRWHCDHDRPEIAELTKCLVDEGIIEPTSIGGSTVFKCEGDWYVNPCNAARFWLKKTFA